MHPASAPAPEGLERPRFRQDLFAELIEAQGARFIDVMAPEGGNVFRLYEVEYSLACGMDGERDVDGIVKWAQDELGLTPSQQEVRTVIVTLGDLGFIDGLSEGLPEEPTERGQIPLPEPEPAVVPPPARPQPLVPEVPLGAAGTAERLAKPVPAPSPAATLEAPKRPTRPTPVPPEPSEVSIDLADHVEVRPDDVKEAVRASRVMPAVEMPEDLPEPINDRPTAPALALESPFSPPEISRPHVSRSQLSRPPEVSRSEASRSEVPRSEVSRSEVLRPPESAWPEPKSDPRAAKPSASRPPAASKPPVELPPPVISDKHPTSTVRTSPPRPARGTSPVLLVLFVLVIAAAGGFFVWKYVLDKPAVPTPSSVPAPPVVKPPPPAPPPAPPPSAKIALETPAPDEVTLSRAGQIETILADKTDVKDGDVIMRLVGDKPLEAELGGLGRDQKRVQDLIDAATRRRDAAHASGNKSAETQAQAEITDRQKTLALKQNALAAKTAELDNFLIHAPASGTFSPAVRPGARVAAGTVVARIQRDPVPSATFKIGNPRAFAANASVELAIGKGEQRVTCTVAEVEPDGVKVVCPVDPALTEGAEVALNAPTVTAPEATPSAPGTVATPPTPGEPTGAAPSGAAPSETAPSGAAPSGAAPSGAAPSGAAPSGAAPSEGGSAAPGAADPSGQPAKAP